MKKRQTVKFMDELPDILDMSNKMDKEKKLENPKNEKKEILDSFIEENPDVKMDHFEGENK